MLNRSTTTQFAYGNANQSKIQRQTATNDDDDKEDAKNTQVGVTKEDELLAKRIRSKQSNLVERIESIQLEQWKSKKKQMKQMKPILNQLDQNQKVKELKQLQSNVFDKYSRKTNQVSNYDQKLFQIKNKDRNKEEIVDKTKWNDLDRNRAEVNLVETEILRHSTTSSATATTTTLSPQQIQQSLQLKTKSKVFDLSLPTTSPYLVKYNRSGRHVLLASKYKGHVAVMDWRKFTLLHQSNSHQNVVIRDLEWIMDDSMYALTNGHTVQLYDNDNNALVHTWKLSSNTCQLHYLPFHFLLNTCTSNNELHWCDVSMGVTVAHLSLKEKVLDSCMNPYNAMIHTANQNGTVHVCGPRDVMYKPSMTLLCHSKQVPIVKVCVDSTGHYMVTASMDQQVAVWDIRKTNTSVTECYSPAQVNCMSVSEMGMLVLNCTSSNQLFVWKHLTELNSDKVYLKCKVNGAKSVESLSWCPHEDVLCVGHSNGVSSMIIPESGNPNLDSQLPNPYYSNKDSSNFNVKSLLEKIPWQMISVDPSVIGTSGLEVWKQQQQQEESQHILKDSLQEKMKEYGLQQQRKRKSSQPPQQERQEREEQWYQMKQKKAKYWYENENATALDRFAVHSLSRQQQVNLLQEEEE